MENTRNLAIMGCKSVLVPDDDYRDNAISEYLDKGGIYVRSIKRLLDCRGGLTNMSFIIRLGPRTINTCSYSVLR